MSNLVGVPLVRRESNDSKTCKMLFISGFIVVIILFVIYNQESCILMYGNQDYIETLTDVHPKDTNAPILGKYIQLINLNKSILPIETIVIIDNDKKMITIDAKTAKYNTKGSSGAMWEFVLDKSLYIAQIIIILNLSDARKKDISTTQVRIRDDDYDTIWTNNKPLQVGKYVDVFVTKPKYLPSIPQRILDPSFSTDDQEVVLNRHLIVNTW